MYQIFVVEDESLIRQSIRTAVEKMQGPYVCCGEASDGEMALSMMQDLMPDILLTDIRMPFLDGFGLIRHAKAMMPWLKIVVISGYGDFEYTQKAISLGVDQYLLKPVRQADLIRVIEEMAGRIEQDKLARESLSSRMDEQEVLQALRQQFMQQLLYGGSTTEELLEKARTLKMDLVRGHYLLSVCLMENPAADPALIRQRAIKSLTSMDGMTCYVSSADQMTLFSCGNDAEALSEQMYHAIQILRHELKDLCPVITAVIANDVKRLGAVAEAYRTASGILRTVSSVAAGHVINVSDTAQLTADLVQASGPFGPAFRQKLAYAQPADIPQLVDEAFSANQGVLESVLMRYNALISVMRIAADLIAAQNPDAGQKDIAARLSGEYDILTAAGSADTCRQAARDMLRQALSARQDNAGNIRYSHVISQAEKYVRENFNDPNISLISAARHVNMSAAHFSTVFSQTTGRSFITYLTALRIGRAKELLRDTSMRLSDIAMEIGYNEPNYFSHVFRKTEGITPKEYRRLQGRQ